jgi:hypothetical protein
LELVESVSLSVKCELGIAMAIVLPNTTSRCSDIQRVQIQEMPLRQ